MNEAQTFFAQPGVGFFTMILIGAIAGWIAERITQSNHGIFTNILVGVAGAFVGQDAVLVVSPCRDTAVERKLRLCRARALFRLRSRYGTR